MRFRCDFGKQSLFDVSIDRRNAKRFPFGIFQMPAARNRLRRPVPVQSCNDEVPCFRPRTQRHALLFSAAANIKVLRPPMVVPIWIVRLLVRFPFGAVALDLPADR